MVWDEVLERSTSVKALIIDDDIDVVESIKFEIQDFISGSVTVTEAYDGRAGMIACEREEFDIIVTDYNMPMMNGIEFIENIKHSHGMNSNTPVIFLSAMKPHLRSDEVLWENVFFLQKPWKVKQIQFLLKVCLVSNNNEAA